MQTKSNDYGFISFAGLIMTCPSPRPAQQVSGEEGAGSYHVDLEDHEDHEYHEG